MALAQLPKKARDSTTYTVWDSIVKNYDMILGAQLSNSFIILLALSESGSSSSSLTATEISKAIATRTNGKLFKVLATLQDSIEKRLKREGLVEAKKTNTKVRYSITDKGRQLLLGWKSFIMTYQ
jgi:DNA-binding PadR family transcriptional regulator